MSDKATTLMVLTGMALTAYEAMTLICVGIVLGEKREIGLLAAFVGALVLPIIYGLVFALLWVTT